MQLSRTMPGKCRRVELDTHIDISYFMRRDPSLRLYMTRLTILNRLEPRLGKLLKELYLISKRL